MRCESRPRVGEEQQNESKIYLDLVCNEFEYEILYKRAFVSQDGLEMNQDGMNA
jgi:hypothetical protein